MGVNVQVKEHPTWVNWRNLHVWEYMDSIGVPPDPIVGKYQYIYSSEKGKISLVQLPDYFKDGQDLWETYCLEGNLFEDIERFGSKHEAEERIFSLL